MVATSFTLNLDATAALQRLLFVHSPSFVIPGARDLSAAWQQIALAVNKAPVDTVGVLAAVAERLGFTPRPLTDEVYLTPDPFNEHLRDTERPACFDIETTSTAPSPATITHTGDAPPVLAWINNINPIPLLLETICGEWTLVLEVDGVKTTHVGRRVAVLSYTHEETARRPRAERPRAAASPQR